MFEMVATSQQVSSRFRRRKRRGVAKVLMEHRRSLAVRLHGTAWSYRCLHPQLFVLNWPRWEMCPSGEHRWTYGLWRGWGVLFFPQGWGGAGPGGTSGFFF